MSREQVSPGPQARAVHGDGPPTRKGSASVQCSCCSPRYAMPKVTGNAFVRTPSDTMSCFYGRQIGQGCGI